MSVKRYIHEYESVLSAFIDIHVIQCRHSSSMWQRVTYCLIKESPFATIPLPCLKCITSIPSDLHLWLCELQCDDWDILELQTGLFFGLSGLLPFCDCAYALFPHLISSSGVCGTLGGERRLLQPRFVVRPSASLFSPAWSDDRFKVHRRTACVCSLFYAFMYHFVTLLFNGCKHEDCILAADNTWAHLHLSLWGTVWLFGVKLKNFDLSKDPQ